MKYGWLIVVIVTLLLFLAGCINEKEKTELISLCNSKTNISYSDAPICLTATKCQEKYNSIFGSSLTSDTLKIVETAKSNYQKSVVDSWVGISNLLETTKKVNDGCEDPTSDSFVNDLQYLYSYSKISSKDLANLGYRQTVLLGTIKNILENNDINLMGDTEVYKTYTEVIDNWNTLMNNFVLVNKEFNLQQTKYNYWATFNSSYLYAPGKVSSQSVDSYKNIIKYGLLQDDLFGFTLDIIPENTLLSAFADAIYDNVIGSDSVSYENLSSVFEQYFNLGDFIKEYSSLFGYGGTLINSLNGNISELDSEIRTLELTLDTQKKDIEKNFDELKNLEENSDTESYLLSYFGMDTKKIDYSEKIANLKLQLQNLDKSLGKKYQVTNQIENELKTILDYKNKQAENNNLISFLCSSELNSIITENKNNATLSYYFNKFKSSKDITDCYYFLKNSENTAETDCDFELKKLIDELHLEYNSDPQFSCEELQKLKSNILLYLDKITFGEIKNNVINAAEKVNVINYKSPICAKPESYDLLEFKKQIKGVIEISESIIDSGLQGLIEKINYWNTKSAEVLENSLSCHLTNKARLSNNSLIFDVGFNYDGKINTKIKTNYNITSLSGQCLDSYICKNNYCDLIFSCLKKLTNLVIEFESYKQEKQEINYSDDLEIAQKFCFENDNSNPIFDEIYSADKISVYSDYGKEIKHYLSDKKIQLWNQVFEKGDCIFIKYYFYDAIKKALLLESTDKISENITRYKYKLELENTISVTQNNIAVNLDFYYDAATQNPTIFDSQGKEYKITKTNSGFVFYASLGALSKETYSILFYAKDEQKKFIFELTNIKTTISDLANSKSNTIKEEANSLLKQISSLETVNPKNNKLAFDELTALNKSTSDLITKNKKFLVWADEKDISIKKLKNQKNFLEQLKSNSVNLIKKELIKEFSSFEVTEDLAKLNEQINLLEQLPENSDIPKLENIRDKYTKNLESLVEDGYKKYLILQDNAKALDLTFYENSRIFDSAKESLFFEDYNALFNTITQMDALLTQNELIINTKVSEIGENILTRFSKITDIKNNLDPVWNKYNFLLNQFNSTNFDLVKKYEKIPVTLSDLKDNKSILDSVSKEIVALNSAEENFKKEYFKNKFDAINDFDSKKIDKTIFNYQLASKNIDDIEATLNTLATKNIDLAEKSDGDKSLLYDAKTNLENRDYFGAIINAKRAMAGAVTTTSKTAIYGLSIVIFGAVAFALYSLVFKKRKKKKITYYTVPK
ncbi:MAG: hypothetical protein PHH82_00135 [Candidatus ainarchaeum sp.]|nr:hypothetical protein [Candidatus ainarchaeum sp.]